MNHLYVVVYTSMGFPVHRYKSLKENIRNVEGCLHHLKRTSRDPVPDDDHCRYLCYHNKASGAQLWTLVRRGLSFVVYTPHCFGKSRLKMCLLQKRTEPILYGARCVLVNLTGVIESQ
jgi:hypothetical protein